VLPHAFLSETIYPAFGKYENSVEEAKVAVVLDPDLPLVYFNLPSSYGSFDRIEQAERTLQWAALRKVEIFELVAMKYII
jgi:hypothetical protein